MGGNKTLKHYVKPELYVERFELAQHIAGCQVLMTLNSGAECTSKDGSFAGMPTKGWFTSAANCSTQMTDYEGYCYTNFGNNLMGMFQS